MKIVGLVLNYFFFGLIFLVYIMLVIPCLWMKGMIFFFLHPFLESSFPAWWSELMRVWPPSNLNLCALKCKDVGKRCNSDSTHQGMPENQRPWVISSKKDRSGLWNLIPYKQSMTLISTLSACPNSVAPKVICHKQILSWFFFYLCFHQIKI